MNGDKEGILFGGIVVGRVGEPALDVEVLGSAEFDRAGPVDGFDVSGGVGAVVEVGELFGGGERAGEDLGRLGVAGGDKGEGAGAGNADGVFDGAAGNGHFAEIVLGVLCCGRDGVVGEEVMAAAFFDEADVVGAGPGKISGGAIDAGSDVGGGVCFAFRGDDPDVAAGGALVGHEVPR